MSTASFQSVEIEQYKATRVFGPNYESNSEDRSLIDRTFGKMGEGSIRGSIFTICSVAIGAGVLSIPYVIASLGWILGTSMVIVGGLATTWSLKTIVQMANHA